MFVCFAILAGSLSAQDSPEAATLLGKGGTFSAKDLGFFVAPSFGLTRLDESTAALFNLRGGVGLKDMFSLGAYFNTSLNEIRQKSETLSGVYMDYWTAGGFVEITLLSKRLVHLTFPIYVGYGEVEMDGEEVVYTDDLGESNFFQVEPSALLECNLNQFIRIHLGAGYRLVGQMDYRNLDRYDISGWTAYGGLRLGLFR
jgi:hypothetical protein